MYNNGCLDIEEYLNEIDRLILQYENYMYLSETARIEANKYITLRLISIKRQFLLDTKYYIQNKQQRGEKVDLVLER